MLVIPQIENFLEKDIYKIPVPYELGEAPEYAPREARKRNFSGKNKGKKRTYKKRPVSKPEKA